MVSAAWQRAGQIHDQWVDSQILKKMGRDVPCDTISVTYGGVGGNELRRWQGSCALSEQSLLLLCSATESKARWTTGVIHFLCSYQEGQ